MSLHSFRKFTKRVQVFVEVVALIERAQWISAALSDEINEEIMEADDIKKQPFHFTL